MAEPVVDNAAFPNGLHPKKGKTDKGTIKGSGFKKGDPVKVVGHHGKKPIVWTGKVGDHNAVDDTWAIEVTVKHEQQRGKDDKKDRDTEDVSTTVTNATATPPEESQPVVTTGVPLVP
jgi:hypothetical protein